MTQKEIFVARSSECPSLKKLSRKIYDLPILSEQAKRNILGENARSLFNLDVRHRFPK